MTNISSPIASLKMTLLSLALMLLLVGCGAGSGATPTVPTVESAATQADVQEVRITANDNAFEPMTYTVTAGKPVRIIATNAGQNVHEVEVKGLMPETKLAPGQSKTVDLATIEAGKYRVYCEIHGDVGMEGELVAK